MLRHSPVYVPEMGMFIASESQSNSKNAFHSTFFMISCLITFIRRDSRTRGNAIRLQPISYDIGIKALPHTRTHGYEKARLLNVVYLAQY